MVPGPRYTDIAAVSAVAGLRDGNKCCLGDVLTVTKHQSSDIFFTIQFIEYEDCNEGFINLLQKCIYLYLSIDNLQICAKSLLTNIFPEDVFRYFYLLLKI